MEDLLYAEFDFSQYNPLANINAILEEIAQKNLEIELKWSAAASTYTRSSVKIPASKLRLLSDFIPMPAPVRFAEPT